VELNKDKCRLYKKSGFKTAFLLYYRDMINDCGDKLGIFIVPTGVGASVGGYAGDASYWARKFSKIAKLIVNPNVVNAGGFSGINDNMLYVEGYSLDEFVKGNLNLSPVTTPNKVGIVFDRDIPQDVLNVHLNTMNAVKTVYGVDIPYYEVTEEPVGVEFKLDESGISNGSIRNMETMKIAAEHLIQKGCDAIALVCLFEDPEGINEDYADGEGTDPVGGVEAIISHYISQKLRVPCAHSPAFEDYQIYPDIVNPKSASEYITPTFLPCILLGLAQAPKLVQSGGISVDEVDFIIAPYNSLGSPAILAAATRGIKIYAVKENSTVLDVTPEKLGIFDKVTTVDTYEELYSLKVSR